MRSLFTEPPPGSIGFPELFELGNHLLTLLTASFHFIKNTVSHFGDRLNGSFDIAAVLPLLNSDTRHFVRHIPNFFYRAHNPVGPKRLLAGCCRDLIGHIAQFFD